MRPLICTALMSLALAVPALAQEAAPSAAVSILLRQGENWLRQNRADLAALSVERALAAEPRNTDALALAARVEAARGNREASTAAVARLRAAGGTAEQAQAAEGALRAANLDRGGLEEARRLAREGRANDAAARYRALFGENPPEQFALEYFQSLAASDRFREEGRRGLTRLAGGANADPRARLANAESLTYQPATRAEGIRQLSELAARPEVATEARAAWRQALLWSLGDPQVTPLAEAFLRRFPDDDLRTRLAAAQTRVPTPDPTATLRQEGFAQLEAGAARQAAQRFEQALGLNAADADALGGLGIVRLREGRTAEARQLLERAVAADPARRAQWQRALDGAAYAEDLAGGRAALRRNALDEADEAARNALRREVDDRSDAENLAGEVALRRGDAAGAEQRFRAVLARRPGFAPARQGLAAALRAQGRIAEVPRAEREAPETSPTTSTREATGLRAEAARSNDPAVATALLRGALAGNPNDPWLRLDLARALRRQGRGAEGRALLDDAGGNSDASFAAALFAEEDGRLADADALLTRIPPARRNADMQRLAARVRTQRDVAQAALLLRGGVGPDSRGSLLALAARPDPSGQTGAAVIRAFADAGDRFGAAEAARVATAANRSAGAGASIALAGSLLAAGLEGEAVALATAAEAGTLTAEQRRDLGNLRAGIAVRSSDRLNEAGNQAQGFEQLRPVLARDPQNTDASLALARLYQGARQPAEALRVAEAVLARDPRNAQARAGAVQAAVALGDRRRAQALLAEGEAVSPRDSRTTLLEARVARGFGDEVRARRLLEAAQEQRQAELGQPALPLSGAGLPVLSSALENPFQRGRAPAPGVVQAQPSDALAREIAVELAQAQEASAPTAAITAGGRIRSGSAGIDRLQEVNGGLEGSVAAPGIGGRLTAGVRAVNLSTGTLGSDVAGLNRFGTNILGGARQPGRTDASGVAGSIGYARGDWLRADIGTNPIGFRETVILGGLEVAPRLTNSLRVRLVGERRSVTDSLLSYAGVRDVRTNTWFGSVVRTGGRGQVELPIGAGGFYVGGGYAQLTGVNVQDNTRIEAGAGFSYPVIREPGAELTLGLDLVYFGFDRNLRGFTLGQGGYFSPQQYFGVSVPVDYRGRSGDVGWRLGATLGYATYREDGSDIFPTNASLQRQAVARAAADPTVQARLANQSRSGFVGGVRGDLDYNITRDLALSGTLRFDKAPQFDETQVLVRLRNRF